MKQQSKNVKNYSQKYFKRLEKNTNKEIIKSKNTWKNIHKQGKKLEIYIENSKTNWRVVAIKKNKNLKKFLKELKM